MSINRTAEADRPMDQYDQSRQYHPFAKQIDDDQWIVEVPGAERPLGFVRARVSVATGQLEFVVFPWHDESITVSPYDGSHPTLFHAVSWLRWRMSGQIFF
ncbi:MAG: hypothetical protein JWR33_2078 [Naasia sp.]|jgi:hypothetical protein|uniref:hypothetical protein n=1 Tax=Naasia sp. TaxID=2546198 RepID=UPI00263230CE|nr:hypothetical protein [Naasia sp.]MCU1571337.1 hypothetical protein [Naasia sp.]